MKQVTAEDRINQNIVVRGVAEETGDVLHFLSL